ncbi:hypothetical protein [Sphingomonas melonis]|uniref:hypothetical protein n=1 Tax=Sphingomonas melonis TaxID=152682 RepID=UPI0035C7FC63
MTEDEANQRLSSAMDHLHAFAATFNPDELIDEESGLTADDLNVLLHALEVGAGLRVVPRQL